MNNYVQNLTDEAWSSKIDRVFLPKANDYERKCYLNRYFLVCEKAVRVHYKNTIRDSNPLIIDAACGDGAGSAFLAEQFPDWIVMGVDIDEEIIKYAKKEYNYKSSPRFTDNLVFMAGSIMDIKKTEADVFVCMETIEHIERDLMNEFLVKVSESLKPGGKFVVSTPRLRPRESTVKRPGHINELYYQEFKYILGMHFPMFEFYSLDRYGNVVPDSPDANLMVAVCSKWPVTNIF